MTFEEWRDHHVQSINIHQWIQSDVESAWIYQQARIDELETELARVPARINDAYNRGMRVKAEIN